MSTNSTVQLCARRVRFLSEHDETAFFDWAGRMQGFAAFAGSGDAILIDIKSQRLADDQLRELIAMFHRYQIDMRQLLVFENRSNKLWLRNKRAYWHRAMYEEAPVA